MTFTLTDDQVQKLNASIDAAQGAGSCQYVKDGQPCCVIAQLAHREGIKIEDMQAWDHLHLLDNEVATSENIHAIMDNKSPGSEVLAGYDSKFLRKIQGIWDSPRGRNEVVIETMVGALRKKMHDLVSAYSVKVS